MRHQHLFFPLALLMAWGFLSSPVAAESDWKEVEAPPPPTFSKQGLIAIDVPGYTSLKFGVDPASLSIGSDGVLHYVMVAYSSSGSINAMYEGLRCDTAEFKTYARSSEAGHWNVVKEPQWRALDAREAATRHSLTLARQGACDGHILAAKTVPELIRLIRFPRKSLEY